jgi:uncharacterized integral membrane protein
MNAKLLLKMVFILLILLLLVLMGMGNQALVDFSLPPLMKKAIRLPAAVMYFLFFAVGLLCGTILTAGRGGAKSAGNAKSAKSDR